MNWDVKIQMHVGNTRYRDCGKCIKMFVVVLDKVLIGSRPNNGENPAEWKTDVGNLQRWVGKELGEEFT